MIDGRDKMLDNVENELRFLTSMRISALEGIALHEKLIDEHTIKLAEAHELMDRFEQRTEMVVKLQESLNDFQAGLDALVDMGYTIQTAPNTEYKS